MKRITLIIITLLFICSAGAQSIIGSWYGMIKTPQGAQLRIVFDIKQDGATLTGTMKSIDQTGEALKAQIVELRNDTVTIKIPTISFTFKGTISSDADSIKGAIFQGFAVMPTTLVRTPLELATKKQEPTPPYPYICEDVVFTNTKADVELSGTLTIPKEGKSFAAAVLVSGSGPQDRDEKIMGHRPFLVLADHLTRNGIAVLRYDDRGVGKSKGSFATATTYDFAQDAAAAVNYLRQRSELDPTKIGIIGHSEGGIIAPLVAAQDSTLGFIVLLAAPGVPTDSIILMQSRLIAQASGVAEATINKGNATNRALYKLIKDGADKEQLIHCLQEREAMDSSTAAKAVQQLTSPWFRSFITLDPRPVLERVKCPVYALNGERDLQVPYRENLATIAESLSKGGNSKVTIKSIPNLNHLFQECQSGLPQEYADIEQTFSPLVLQLISDWIQERFH